jgi:hypothetical protein
MFEFIVTYWLEALFTLLCSIFAFLFKRLFKRIKENRERQNAVEAGLQALLRNELIKSYREYEAKGEISILDKENMEHMFTEYENLGGNGTVAQMFKEILSLPIKIIK